jgi:hypothetical protein
MKEQTPITAEAIARSFLDPCIVNPTEIKDLEKYIEQFAQAKVLEALEGFAKHLEKTGVFVMLDVEEYYETEVKPRYQNKDE